MVDLRVRLHSAKYEKWVDCESVFHMEIRQYMQLEIKEMHWPDQSGTCQTGKKLLSSTAVARILSTDLRQNLALEAEMRYFVNERSSRYYPNRTDRQSGMAKRISD
jgi:hypothetical protein